MNNKSETNMKENENVSNEIQRGITIKELRKIKAFENYSDNEAHKKCNAINGFAKDILASIPFKQYLKDQNENERNK